jgi:hypothetical protein
VIGGSHGTAMTSMLRRLTLSFSYGYLFVDLLFTLHSMGSALLSRFDLVFILLDKPDVVSKFTVLIQTANLMHFCN